MSIGYSLDAIAYGIDDVRRVLQGIDKNTKINDKIEYDIWQKECEKLKKLSEEAKKYRERHQKLNRCPNCGTEIKAEICRYQSINSFFTVNLGIRIWCECFHKFYPIDVMADAPWSEIREGVWNTYDKACAEVGKLFGFEHPAEPDFLTTPEDKKIEWSCKAINEFESFKESFNDRWKEKGCSTNDILN